MSGRPFSVNNPFRNASNDSSIHQYQGDQQYQDWVKGQNSHDDVRSGGSEYGRYSVGSVSPPPAPGRTNTNPFLDDVVYDTPSGKPPAVSGGRRLTAEEEKEQLRQRYAREREAPKVERTRDLPPAYEDVAHPRKGYPKEKESYNGHSSTTHRSGGSRRAGSAEEYARGDRLPHRHHSHRRHQDSSPSRKEKRKSKVVMPKNVDTIDKLDVTGLFGGSFHHDGPFDAVTPHRNKNSKAAPVLAFPADGPNSTIGGVSTKKSAMNEVFGVEEDDDTDLYNIRDRSVGSTASVNTKDAIRGNVGEFKQVDVKSKTDKVHGPTTYGLGSTTFLDGAPASKAAIRDDIRNHSQGNRMGVQRHKSLSQRLGIAGENSRSGSRANELSRTRSGPTEDGHDRYRSESNPDDEEDVYLGLPQSSLKKSSGSKFLKRVRSLKVGRK
ncbi:hypothetical protein RNJ44_01550 [Nakaseomyces bracarensis]|uniref:Pal1 cell morphology protein n=1 Tax=Nakaseomyces bracarensis TaxID=273131 RepID=A0ABR4NQ91_9SACH